jgi:DNA helicase-2/ATP-dependent DNA helicase PcrA
MHSAKGLEFPVVFIVGMEEGVFPHSRAFTDEEELEEERRLAYVGITRAEEELFLSCARMRTLFGRTAANAPSRFLTEIPQEILENLSAGGGEDRYSRATRQAWAPSGGSRFGAGAASSRSGGGSTTWGQPSSFGKPSAGASQSSSVSSSAGKVTFTTNQPVGDNKAVDYKMGDKVSHGKWGIGTVVSMKGAADDTELQIAFPAPVGVKRLLAKFAPITKES